MNGSCDLNANWFSRPGDSLLALMQREGRCAEAVAGILSGGMPTLRGFLDGSIPIDHVNAEVLAQHVGGTADFWIRRQAGYEERLQRAVSSAVVDADRWMNLVPAPQSRVTGAKRVLEVDEAIRERMTYFGVSNLDSWHERYGKHCSSTHFRTSASFMSKDAAVLLWLRKGELEADLISTAPWDPEKLNEKLPAIRALSRISQPARFVPKLKSILASVGVACITARTPRGCHASGATRMVTPSKAMMLLSFRHRSDDHFWFTVFHEIGHLLLHQAATFVDADDTPMVQQEVEANAFASNCIVPGNRVHELRGLANNRKALIRFSGSVGVAPGMVVGQMQYRQIIEHDQMNALKRKWTWDELGTLPMI